jgi:CBS domain containing-hemolysin-like protein
MDLSDALTRFAQSHFEELPVVEESNPKLIVGMARRRDVITEYDRRLLEARTAPMPAKSC